MHSTMDNQRRLELLEAALTEYVERYGLSERARAALMPGASGTSENGHRQADACCDGERWFRNS